MQSGTFLVNGKYSDEQNTVQHILREAPLVCILTGPAVRMTLWEGVLLEWRTKREFASVFFFGRL